MAKRSTPQCFIPMKSILNLLKNYVELTISPELTICPELPKIADGRISVKESQLKKRTCSQCGTTVPLSARAFPYCGGCRRSSVARKDRPRFCGFECQRAHWVAGHMYECPCTHLDSTLNFLSPEWIFNSGLEIDK